MNPAETIIADIQDLLGCQPLQPASERAPEHGGQLAAVMPFKEGVPKYATDKEGNILGLNLANTGLTDAHWQQICALLPERGASLRALNLSDNQLTSFDLSELGHIERLNLSDNQIKKFRFPEGTGLAAKMTDLNLGNNPVGEIPVEVMAGGRKRVLDYFREKELAGEVKSLEAKVVLVGESEAGKTSLRVRLIKGESARLPAKGDRTKGLEVEVEPFYVDLPGGERMRLNLFDFAGQTFYKPLHQFFYSHRSLYVLVTKNGDDSNQFDYWFETAQLFGGGSPVLVVNNLTSDIPSGFNRSRFARFDAIIKDSLDTNLFTSENFSKVKTRIGQLAADLPTVSQIIPRSWANVRQELEARRKRNLLPLDEYLEICARPENGGMDEDRAVSCSAYLHDIGVCLHYPKKEFPALHRYVIVRNEWATDAVYRVMEDKDVNGRHGHFDTGDLYRIWQPRKEDIEQGEGKEQGKGPRYERYVPELLELMHEFKLCYPLKDLKSYVAPSLLPKKQDGELRWQPDQDLQFEMEYDFMPSGLFPRFVVDRYEDIAGDNRNLVWCDEVFFQWDNARANVTQPSRAGKNAIVFRVQGKDLESRKLMLTSLLHDLKKLHPSGIKVEERIPCICAGCKDSLVPHFFQKSDIDRFKDKGWKSIQCLIHGEPVDVGALLGHIFYTSEEMAAGESPEEEMMAVIKAGDLEKGLELMDAADYEEAGGWLGEFRAGEKGVLSQGADPAAFALVANRIRGGAIELLRKGRG